MIIAHVRCNILFYCSIGNIFTGNSFTLTNDELCLVKKKLIFILNKTKFIYILLPDEDGVGIDSDMMIYVGDYIYFHFYLYNFENLYYKA